MKILYDHQIFSRQSYGGVSRYFHEIAERIPAISGDDVQVFAPISVNRYAQAPGLRVKKFKGGAPLLGLVNVALGKVIISHRTDVSIFHETYYSRLNYSPKNARRVVTVYDMIHELFPSSFSKYDQTRDVKFQAVKRADHIICISESTRRDLLQYADLPESKVSVVHLGHSLATPSLKAVPDQNPSTSPYLLYVGQRGGYKNFTGFLHAYAASAALQEHFAIVCFGGGELTQAERALARSLNILPTKIIHRSGDDALLARSYSAAAALVYPSHYEGFGIPPIEAMSHGCPVVASNTSSIPEVVGNAAELFDPADPHDIQTAIERVVFSADRSRQLASMGHERIKQFTWDACALGTLNVYRQILES